MGKFFKKGPNAAFDGTLNTIGNFGHNEYDEVFPWVADTEGKGPTEAEGYSVHLPKRPTRIQEDWD